MSRDPARHPRRVSRRRSCRAPARGRSVDDFTAQAQRLLRDWDFTSPTASARRGAPRPTTTRCGSNLLELHLRRRAARPTRGRRRQPVDGRRGAAAHQPQERLVGQQADPRRHRGLGRDPRAGARRGPPRARPASSARTRRRGGGDACTGSTSSTRCMGADGVPGPVRWLFDAGPSSSAAATRSSTPTRWNASRAGYDVDRRPVDADGRRPRQPRRVPLGQPDRRSPATPTTTTTPTRSTRGRPTRRSRGRSARRPCARRPTTS